MLVYGSLAYADGASGYTSGVKAAYDYRAFGEQIDLTNAVDKVTENFTGKEKDDETDLNYFGARYLDPMLGLWISVDAKRQFASPYLYMGNGYNPIIGHDPDGNAVPLIVAFGIAFLERAAIRIATSAVVEMSTAGLVVTKALTDPNNAKMAAKVGVAGEMISRINPNTEKAYDEAVSTLSNGLLSEVTSTLDMTKTLTEQAISGTDDAVKSIKSGLGDFLENRLKDMQNTPAEDMVD